MVVVAMLLGRPVWHLLVTAWRDDDQREPASDGFADDASRLNRTAVAEVVAVERDPAAAVAQLKALLERARAQGLPVSIAGARHSMGGHTIAPDGIQIDMLPFNEMQLEEETGLLHVGAGARWRDVIAYLDLRQKSVAVMQSDNTFSVGGSLSVNCHGWQHGQPPIASTVESLRVMTADGSIVNVSRTDNPDLFSLVLGGYGLFGIILDARLRVVPNERYRLEQFVVPVDEALSTYTRTVQEKPDAVMVYARMSVARSRFLEEVILNVLYRDPASDGSLPALDEPGLAAIRRSLFRGSVGSEYGKELRWEAETRLQPHLSRRHFSRNQLLNEGSETYQNRSADSTDILHEYFVPARSIEPFVVKLREIIPRSAADLLNVTVREIEPDTDTFLRYADESLFSLVMLFNQPRIPASDASMQALTHELIEAALATGGRYYLPYRLHATPEQFHRAYPKAREFFDFKRQHDPGELFQNRFYQKYGRSVD